ncbi:2319_t:CDS:10 [Diversispora eburnea]|uniref:2319_t:CDS:1 n=1 Tax=Diversispora eburnea TaxID=1213867 RepID=A0A9N9AYA2_9GLOM|nr:2319_t:CDS:10 [Diversispora eburnea]
MIAMEDSISESVHDKVSEAETESTRSDSSSNLRRSTRTRKPPKYLLQEVSIPARKTRRVDYDKKNSNVYSGASETENDSPESLPERVKRRGRPKKSSTTQKNVVQRTKRTRRTRKTPEEPPENSVENLMELRDDSSNSSEITRLPEAQNSNKQKFPTNVSRGEPLEESGQTIYESIFSSNTSLENAAFNWSCGCSETLERKTFEESDNIPDVLKTLQDVFKKEPLADYPLISKAKEYKKFRKNLLIFFRRLIGHVKYDVIYDDFFFDTIQAWVVPMSSSPSRPFRHTATTIALNLFSCICEVAQEVHKEWSITSRQLESENRNKASKTAIKELQLKTTDLNKKKNRLYSYFDDLFDGVFVHRYRDVEPIIRSECIKELGVLIIRHPDRFLGDTIIRYLGWQLSDKSPIVRLESLKVLEQLYENETFVSGLRNFTERFKPRLLEMAIRESDVNVRISSIQILTLIHKIGLLDDDERDQLSLLIYCDISKVRKAIASFVKISLEEDFIKEKRTEVQTLMTSSGTKRKRNIDSGSNEEINSTKHDWIAFKCLAEFLIKYGKTLKGDVESSRIGLAIQDLWADLDILHEWHILAEYLSKDHSSTSQSQESQDNINSSDTIEDCYRLSEKEESALVQVFVKCLQLSLVESVTAKDKKKADEQITGRRAEISRTMITILPRLLTKYAPDPGRIVEVLRVPQLMNLSVYSDLRMLKAFEFLVEDIKKLYLKHTHPLVLNHAAATFQYMKQYDILASTVETYLGELQDEVVKTFLEECENKELLDEELTSDQIHSLSVALIRLEQLITVINVINMDDFSEENNKDVYNYIIKLTRRGLLNNFEEEKMVISAINFLWYYLLWKVEHISSEENAKNITPDSLDNFITKRNQIAQTMYDIGISVPSEAPHSIKLAAFRVLGNIYWLFSSDLFEHSSIPELSKLKLECRPGRQERIEQFVEEEIESYRNIYNNAEKKLLKERKNVVIDEEQDFEKPVKKATKNVDIFIEPEERLQIMEIIGTLLRGVRGGWFHVSRSASVICQYGTLGADLDDVIKKLISEFKERISSGETHLFANVFIHSLKKSHSLYVERHIDSTNGTSWLARLCSNALQFRGNKSSRKETGHIVELHKEGISYITSIISGYRLISNNEAISRVIKFFKILTMLLTGINFNDANKIESFLKQEIEANEIIVVESDKQWEPYYSYLLRINNITKKGGGKKDNSLINNEVVSSSSKRSAPVDDDETKSPPKKRKRSSPAEDNNEATIENEDSDRESNASFQSVADIRSKKKLRR